MARTPSTMLPLGTVAPSFSLPSTSGRTVTLAEYAGKPALLVVFMCNHCPFVKHLAGALAQLANDYQPRGLAMVGISSNDVSAYPADSLENMKIEAQQRGYAFEYLYDATQAVAKAYRAACTPDFFLFDSQQKLVYRGQFDSSRPDNGQSVTGADLRAAIDAVLAGQIVSAEQRPSLGCNIKWIAGNEPDYYT